MLAILAVDQAVKFWVKTNMYIGETHNFIGSFLQIHFIENNGMAFGMVFGEGETPKIVLTLLRIVAVFGIGFILNRLVSQKKPMALLVAMALILAGALGNIIDSVFYGVLFSESMIYYPVPAEFLPEAGGYAPFFQGKVVDMFHFNVTWPDFMPFGLGGRYIFPPIFNVADISITFGVSILVFLGLRGKI